MAYAELTVSEQSFLQHNIFETIAQIRSNNKHPQLPSQDRKTKITLCTIFATTNFTARR